MTARKGKKPGEGGGRAAPGLWRDQRGQAVVETMLAMMLLALFLVALAQLFLISDLAAWTLVGAHRKATREIHDLDNQMKFQVTHEVAVTKSLPALPGLERALGFFDQAGTPGQFSVTRRLAVAGGSLMGSGENSYYWVFTDFPYRSWAQGSGSRLIKFYAGWAN